MKPDSQHVLAHSATGRPSAAQTLLGLETVAHEVARLDRELLALVALGLRELRIVVAQREASEGDVARLVLHHVRVHAAASEFFAWSRIDANAASARPSISTCMPR
jgi:hypothetical protein